MAQIPDIEKYELAFLILFLLGDFSAIFGMVNGAIYWAPEFYWTLLEPTLLSWLKLSRMKRLPTAIPIFLFVHSTQLFHRFLQQRNTGAVQNEKIIVK